MRLSRRAVVGGAASVAGLGLWFGWRNRFGLQLFLRLQRDASRPQLDPSEVGSLTDSEREGLWQLALGLQRHWDLAGLERSEFVAVLDLKTERPPSYLAEYRRALAAFDARGGPSIDAILEVLAAPRREGEAFTVEAHVQSNVIEEFLRLALARGGFQRFGLANHPGFPGGVRGYRLADG